MISLAFNPRPWARTHRMTHGWPTDKEIQRQGERERERERERKKKDR